jgi:hypothetical protein
VNDLQHIIAALENEHPTTIAMLREFLPRFISMMKNVRRDRISTALDAAHTHLAQYRRDADETVRARTIMDSGESG